ncbi:MAG: hypothetical protein HY699_05975, partial [Deltaproteobacteria bacterium]|nr:hypothetical protein [Deltaproteobacteria bacterium]
MTAAEIADAIGGHRSGGGWLVRCPAHDDRTPSLSVTERDGRLLVRCHAGCNQSVVIEALRARGLWPDAARGSTARAKRDGAPARGHADARSGAEPRVILPVPESAPAPVLRHREHGVASQHWIYRDA